jgi:WD40 repeat protein
MLNTQVGGGQHSDWVLCMAAKGDRLFSASRDKTIKVWDLSLKNVKPIQTISGHDAPVTALLLKGSYLLSADGKGVIKVILIIIRM